ncbi:MAG: putative fluoride ion transporter CrcB [Verrucomicrobia subdivision 3 bacterium]|nr:putative fluoride ion transporter CrcB [Limisphaerales bacterium]MCS1412894.1 putative fluoride ion transporter CrcB [Limisphaerales bacterium]
MQTSVPDLEDVRTGCQRAGDLRLQLSDGPPLDRARRAYGTTDELCINAVTNPVHVHDLQATILHLLGIESQTLDLQTSRPSFPWGTFVVNVVGSFTIGFIATLATQGSQSLCVGLDAAVFDGRAAG